MTRKQALRILTFCSVLVVAHFVLNHLYVRKVLYYTDDLLIHDRVTLEICRDQVSPDVVIFGDSFAYGGINPIHFDSAYTLACPGESFAQTFYRMRYFLDHCGPPPKLLIVSYSWQTIQLKSWPDISRPNPWYDWADLKENGHPSWLWRDVVHFATPRYLEGWKYIQRNELAMLVERDRGYVNSPKVVNADPAVLEEGAILYRNEQFGHEYSIDPVMLDYARRMADICRERNVQVVFLTMPFTEEYSDKIAETVDMESYWKTGVGAINPGGSVHYLDNHRLLYGRYELFHDVCHLNVEGAQVYTLMLIEQLRAQGLLPAAGGAPARSALPATGSGEPSELPSGASSEGPAESI